MVAGHMAVPQFRGPITYCVLQWCHPMLTGTQRRTSCSTRMITLFGDHVIKLDSGPRRAEYSAQGMHPDPKKVQGITEMTAPTDKQQLQSFLGMVNYMGTFIPNLSHHTEPLRAMLKKDNVFHWEDQQNTVLSASQDLNCESKHHTVEILRQGSAGNSSSGRFSQRAGSLSHTEVRRKGPADRLCQQEPHGRGDEVCQHQTGTSSHCLCLPKV